MEILGKLEQAELRQTWVHEAHNFTKWLAQEENLRMLGDEIGVDISLDTIEAQVGRFNVDILAEETTSGAKVIIENQLEVTNHDHLGKLITYASGVDAKHVIWVVKTEREEHRRAIDWLNDNTIADVNFFLIRIELWKIGDSLTAPKFVVVCQPNDWTREAISSSGGTSEFSHLKLQYLDFWEGFKDYALEHGASLNLRKAQPRMWFSVAVGTTLWHLSLVIGGTANTMSCEVYIRNNKALFDSFQSQRARIEEAIGAELLWQRLPEKKASRVRIQTNAEFSDEAAWPEYYSWLLQNLERFNLVFNDVFVGLEGY